MLANRLAKTSQGISYPFLYLNSAVSALARITEARASAMEPVMTQPTDEESLKTCDTEEGSISLSCSLSSAWGGQRISSWYLSDGHFLLRQNHGAVFASDPH